MSSQHTPDQKVGPIYGRLIPLLLLAALAEFLCLRLVLRFGQALPPSEELGRVFTGVAQAGLLALNLAVLLGIFVLTGVARERLGQPRLINRMSGALLLAAGVGSAAMAFGVSAPPLVQATPVLSLAAIAASLAAIGAAWRTVWPWSGLALAAYVLLTVHFAGQGPSATLPSSVAAYFGGEILATAAALALVPLLRPAWSWRRAVAVSVPAAALAVGLWVRPWTVASLSVWTLGFTVVLPGPIYAVALAGYLYALASLFRGNPTERRFALALAFVGLAGLKLDFSYFTLLALIGVGLLPTTAGPQTHSATERAESTSPVNAGVARALATARKG